LDDSQAETIAIPAAILAPLQDVVAAGRFTTITEVVQYVLDDWSSNGAFDAMSAKAREASVRRSRSKPWPSPSVAEVKSWIAALSPGGDPRLGGAAD